MAQEITIIRQENIQTIVAAAPQSYQDNKLSKEKCIEAGQTILAAIQAQGMTDELDQQAAIFIEKARKTVKKMNERRSSVTKLFDDIRKEFTTLENAIDPTKGDTIPYQLQQLRNQYAAKKHAEEEERRRREYERQQAEATRARLALDIEEDLMNQFQRVVNSACNELMAINDAVTLDNYDESYKKIYNFQTAMSSSVLDSMKTTVRIPVGIGVQEVSQVEQEIKQRFSARFAEQYGFEVDTNKQYILDRLPSKRVNLERMAQASAEEAARIKAEMEARQHKETEQQEAERRRKEEEEKQKVEMARQQSEMESLFGQQAVVSSGYQSKVKVTQKINLLNPEGIMPILSMWWSKEGCHLTVEELSKMFKKQITFCEKLAKEGTFISDENVEYVEDVKAK